MESDSVRPRRPWLAALLSLFGGPVGQIYAGCLRRSLVLWVVNLAMVPAAVVCLIVTPVGRLSVAVVAMFAFGYPVFLAVDAYLLAKRRRLSQLKSYQKWWFYLVALVVSGVGANAMAYGSRFVLAESFVVPTRSMSPTLQPGDRFMVDKFWSSAKSMRRNDVVAFRSRGPNSPLYVMRVVGLPGDEIEIINEKVIVNGEDHDDDHAYFDADVSPHEPDFGPIQVPADSFFVLGDNRRSSADSRFIGSIPFSDYLGSAKLIYWSVERRFPDPFDRRHFESGPIVWSRIGTRLD